VRLVAEPDHERRALRGVGEDVLKQDVSARREVFRGHLDQGRAGGHGHAHHALLVFGQRPPEGDALGDHRGRVARAPGLLTAALPGLVDDVADRPLHRGDVIEQAGVVQ